MSHVPQDDYSPDGLDENLPDYDSDIKIPGRFYPKLPYQNPYLENDQDDFQTPHYNHHTFYQNNHNLHHGRNYHDSYHKGHQSNQNYHQDQDHDHQKPVMAYGVRRDPSGSTFSRQSHFYNDNAETSDYLDDTRADVPDGKKGVSSSTRHRLGPHQGDKIGPPSTTALPPSPSFDRNTPRSLTVQAGKTARLICQVRNVGDKSVSWMRHEDLHILTVDKYKYSTDSRLSVTFNEADQEWILTIQAVNQEDAGLYECQVSTKPVLSFIVSMNVVDSLPSTTPFPNLRDAEDPARQPKDFFEVPSARIINGPEIYVHRGSLINLTCVVDHTVERPLYIYWYHYNKMIDYDSAGDIVIVRQSGPNTISNLLVKDAVQTDSGKYTCRPSNGEDASVMLHVLNGEHQAAMQTNTSDRIMTSLTTILGAISVGISAVILLCRC